MTRAAVAHVLGCSVFKVRTLEKDGRLHSTMVNGAHLFDPTEVHTLAHSMKLEDGANRPSSVADGASAALCFDRFRKSVSVVDVVCELRIHPNVVEDLHKQFVRMTGALVLTDADLRELERLPGIQGEITTGRSVIDAVARAVRPPLCGTCKANAARLCQGCAALKTAETVAVKTSTATPPLSGP